MASAPSSQEPPEELARASPGRWRVQALPSLLTEGTTRKRAASCNRSHQNARAHSPCLAICLAMVRLVQNLAPGMKASGWGRLIQIASSSALQPGPTGPDYSAAKAAVINLS